MITFVLNIIFITVVPYSILYFDCFSANEWSNNIEKRKPSFGFMMNISIRYGISTFIFLRMIYYMFYGRRIVQLLDDQCFATPYRKHVSQNVALASFILNIILINVQMSSIGNIRKIIIENKLSPHIFALISGYVVTATLLFEIQTLFYYQWLTKQSLSDILKDLKNEHVYTGKYNHIFNVYSFNFCLLLNRK